MVLLNIIPKLITIDTEVIRIIKNCGDNHVSLINTFYFRVARVGAAT